MANVDSECSTGSIAAQGPLGQLYEDRLRSCRRRTGAFSTITCEHHAHRSGCASPRCSCAAAQRTGAFGWGRLSSPASVLALRLLARSDARSSEPAGSARRRPRLSPTRSAIHGLRSGRTRPMFQERRRARRGMTQQRLTPWGALSYDDVPMTGAVQSPYPPFWYARATSRACPGPIRK